MSDGTTEATARLRNEIRTLCDEVDVLGGHKQGTAIRRVQEMAGKWLHEATLAELRTMRNFLGNWEEINQLR